MVCQMHAIYLSSRISCNGLFKVIMRGVLGGRFTDLSGKEGQDGR